jgi:hypothetical protein
VVLLWGYCPLFNLVWQKENFASSKSPRIILSTSNCSYSSYTRIYPIKHVYESFQYTSLIAKPALQKHFRLNNRIAKSQNIKPASAQLTSRITFLRDKIIINPHNRRGNGNLTEV